MSKSKKNFTDPYELMQTVGADALRMYMLSSPIMHAEPLNFTDADVQQIQRSIFGILWNVRQFYLTYAKEDRIEITTPRSLHVLDRWIFSRLEGLNRHMTREMDLYHISETLRPIRLFVDDLSTWWLRRSRERMKQTEDPDDAVDALRTLREVLLTISKLLAPFAPFFAERLYQDLEGEKMSVHLDRWPKVDDRAIDEGLLNEMQWVRDVVNAGQEQRVSAKMPVRQALQKITVRMKDETTRSRLAQKSDYANLIRDELNVEEVVLAQAEASQADLWSIELDLELTPELKKKGLQRELVRHIMQIRKQLKLTPEDQIIVTISISDSELKQTVDSFVEIIKKDTRAISLDTTETALGSPDGSLKWEEQAIELNVQKQ